MIQLKSGDAVSGITSRRLPWFRFLKVEMAELHDSQTQNSTPADGVIWVPKANVLLLQELLRVVADVPKVRSRGTIPGPLTRESEPEETESLGTP
jgi:hypothetical protein